MNYKKLLEDKTYFFHDISPHASIEAQTMWQLENYFIPVWKRELKEDTLTEIEFFIKQDLIEKAETELKKRKIV